MTDLERLQEVLDAVPLHRDVVRPKALAVDREAGTVSVGLGFDPRFRRNEASDALHGGMLATLIDIAAYHAVAFHLRRDTPTVNLRIDYLRPAAGDLRAHGRVLRAGRTVGLVDVEVVDAQDRVVAVGRASFSTLDSGSGG